MNLWLDVCLQLREAFGLDTFKFCFCPFPLFFWTPVPCVFDPLPVLLCLVSFPLSCSCSFSLSLFFFLSFLLAFLSMFHSGYFLSIHQAGSSLQPFSFFPPCSLPCSLPPVFMAGESETASGLGSIVHLQPSLRFNSGE